MFWSLLSLDLAIELFVFTSGVIAQQTFSIYSYKVHSISVITSSFSVIPLFYISKLYLVYFIFRNGWYLYAKYVESILYNLVVHSELCRISDPVLRRKYCENFKLLQESYRQQTLHAQIEFQPIPSPIIMRQIRSMS